MVIIGIPFVFFCVHREVLDSNRQRGLNPRFDERHVQKEGRYPPTNCSTNILLEPSERYQTLLWSRIPTTIFNLQSQLIDADQFADWLPATLNRHIQANLAI